MIAITCSGGCAFIPDGIPCSIRAEKGEDGASLLVVTAGEVAYLMQCEQEGSAELWARSLAASFGRHTWRGKTNMAFDLSRFGCEASDDIPRIVGCKRID